MCKIQFTLDGLSHVTVKIVDVLGIEQCTILDEYRPAGSHEIDFDQSSLSPGSYYYKVYVNQSPISKNGKVKITGTLKDNNTAPD